MEVLVFLAFVSVALAASNCSINPIFVDFHDRCVDNCFTIQYGLFIGLGNPFQNESLWPSLSHNETTFASVDYCADGSSPICTNETHGFYTPGLSTSFQAQESYSALDNSDAITQSLSTVESVGTDTLNVYTHYFDPSPPNVTFVPNFPVTLLANYSSPNTPWFGPAGLLGLGPSSTLLTHLHDADLISSRSFGLYVGTAYPRAGGAINGSLTLGGYDSGRFTGEAAQYDLSPAVADTKDPSPYRVEVASVSLVDASTNEIMVLSQGAFDAYLTTSQFEVTLPDDITNNFMERTSAAPASDDLASSISPDIPAPLVIPDGFEGVLTITLSSGLNITLDTLSGSLRNTSNLSPISSPSTNNATSIPILGTSALAHLYLSTNYDSQPPSFFLSTADIHGPYVVTQSLCPNDVPEAYASPRISSFQRNGTIGAILGGVIGGIGLTFAVWWLFRKYMQRREARKFEEKYGEDGKGKGVSGRGDYDVDEQGLKYLAGLGTNRRDNDRSDGDDGVQHKSKIRGILKRGRRGKLDRNKNPISAYRIGHGTGNPDTGYGLGKRSLSTASSSASRPRGRISEEYDMTDMSQLQASLPPMQDMDRTPSWPLQSQPQSQQAAGLIRNQSESRSRSPSPVFSTDNGMPTTQYATYPHPSQAPSASFPRTVPQHERDTYANVPLTPGTAVPLLDYTQHQNRDQNQKSTLHPSQHQNQNHHRSRSQESITRANLNLSVNTYFDAPPRMHDRVGKKLRLTKKKDGVGVVERKPVAEEGGGGGGWMFRKVFGGGS